MLSSPRCNRACLVPVFSFFKSASHFADTGPPLYGIADIHGDLSQAKATLKLAGVWDPTAGAEMWTGGRAQVVQTGDLVDRGDRSLDCVRLFEQIKVPCFRLPCHICVSTCLQWEWKRIAQNFF